jgi:hypothetical protein
VRRGVGSGAVRGESGTGGWTAIGGKQYDVPGSYTTTQTENIKQLRVSCSECTCTVYCGCCGNALH